MHNITTIKKPHVASKLIIAALTLGSVPHVAAQTTTPLTGSILECAQKQPAIERLACFDAIAETISTTVSTTSTVNTPTEVKETIPLPPKIDAPIPQSPPPAVITQLPQVAPVTEAPTVKAQERPAPNQNASPDNFGVEYKQVELAEKIDAVVSKVITSRFRKTKIMLKNGQLWEQQDNTRLRLKNGSEVSIERGLLGAFFLSIDGRNARMKVKRIQ